MRIGKVVLIKGLMPFLVFTFVSCQYQDNKVNSKEDVRSSKGDTAMNVYCLYTSAGNPNISKINKTIYANFNLKTSYVNVLVPGEEGLEAGIAISSIPLSVTSGIIKKVIIRKNLFLSVEAGGMTEYVEPNSLILTPNLLNTEQIYIGLSNTDLSYYNDSQLLPYGKEFNVFIDKFTKKSEYLNLEFSPFYLGYPTNSNSYYHEIELNTNFTTSTKQLFLSTAFFGKLYAINANVWETLMLEEFNKLITTAVTSVKMGYTSYNISVIIEEQ